MRFAPARPRARSILLTTALAASLATAGCGGDSSTGASGEEGITVQTAQFSWSAAALTNAILARIAADHPDLGVAELETTQLDPAAAWAGAQRGDVDLLTEVALPNQQAFADEAAEQVDIVSETYGNASQGWFVPRYAVEPGGELEGLRSVTQLNDYAEQLGGKFYDADPGYVTTEQNTKRLQGYGIELEHVVAGEAAELAQLERAYGREEPIVLYLYHPHAVFAQYDMVQLEEPTPYTDGCLTTGDGACAMPAYSANIAASKELQEQAPRFTALLEDFRLPLEDVEALQKAVDVDGEDVEEVAATWVEENRSTVDSWVAGA
ncbi:ABC transporter substrate-binding protein [Kineococcus gypseus]|uniref:glycine betaine ABC transporter substrate-binding protein n=1 Tax=Kineococcus gypseus TaxID=1637102 RepID=UPI003D7DDB96